MDENHNLFTVSDENFAEQVLQSALPVIVDFTATWCPPCHALAPVYEKLSQVYAGRLRFARMDVDENPRTVAREGIQGMPTLVLFLKGQSAGRLVGPRPARLQRSIDEMLARINVAV